MAAVDPSQTTVTPTGAGLILLVVTLLFAVPAAIVVVLRCWIRVKHGVFGMDDGLMLAGCILFQAVVGVVGRGVFVGIGARDDRLNDRVAQDGRMYTWMFQFFYCWSLLFIKAAICVNLLRIAVKRSHRIITWITLILSCLSTLVVIIGLMLLCRPIAASWDATLGGKCSPPIVVTSLTYSVSATSVATDLVCSILPGFMLYKAQMKRATKISISIILSMGIMASIATIARIPKTQLYAQPKDYLYNIARIGVWSVFESGTGIIAGSLPSLRRLLKNWINFDSTNGHSSSQMTPYAGTSRAAVTSKAVTGTGSRRMHKGIVTDVAAGREWEHLDDASSSRKIYVQVDMEMQSLERPRTASRSNGSLDELGLPA
ncbi:hypothetical protein ACJ41O_005952 [Fusarium nematophilum]